MSNIKKVNVKKNYKKIEKKKDNNVDNDVAQLEYNNNKYYILTFKYIYIYIDIDLFLFLTVIHVYRRLDLQSPCFFFFSSFG